MKMRRNSSTGLTVLLLLLAPAFTLTCGGRVLAGEDEYAAIEAFVARPPREIATNADDLTKLRFKRYSALWLQVRLRGSVFGEEVFYYTDPIFVEAVGLLVDAELELTTKQEDRIALLESHVKVLREIENKVRDRHLRWSQIFKLLQVTYRRINAEIGLLKAKMETDTPRG
jgi:hypothetical protein